ncbi:unnamed protein product, partial [Meganyctiphanes norvegica]
MDNATCHSPSLNDIEDLIDVQFLPPNTTSLIQPSLASILQMTEQDIEQLYIQTGNRTDHLKKDEMSIRIWQRRDSGQYWPSVCHFLPSPPTCLHYLPDTRKLFMGLDSGTVTEFEVALDYNSVQHIRDYISHKSRVTNVIYSPTPQWVLSVARDKFFVYHCTETGKRLGGHLCSGWCTALQFDYKSKHVFIGDYSGQITMLKLEESGCSVITILKGHNGSIRSLAWDAERQLLFSGSFDQSVIVWDIGGGKGTAFELQGHTE